MTWAELDHFIDAVYDDGDPTPNVLRVVRVLARPAPDRPHRVFVESAGGFRCRYYVGEFDPETGYAGEGMVALDTAKRAFRLATGREPDDWGAA